ncbi:MAG: hypothetical protein GY913_28230 [Proteobacteria bacterium]|nr:hypothetical protein [Pseudomonadota bacterium]MCP4920800.1 hypothetical protein [Pseudomonadota bacterium]
MDLRLVTSERSEALPPARVERAPVHVSPMVEDQGGVRTLRAVEGDVVDAPFHGPDRFAIFHVPARRELGSWMMGPDGELTQRRVRLTPAVEERPFRGRSLQFPVIQALPHRVLGVDTSSGGDVYWMDGESGPGGTE